jgi:RecA/RadA recombinase
MADNKSSKVAAESQQKATVANEGKNKALGLALETIEKQFGKGSIMKLGETTHANVETVSTGSLSLDLALGGGIPKGRIIEIYGPESSGKTTLTLHAIAEVQRLGGTAAFIDAEHALDPSYAKRIGVDVTTCCFHSRTTASRHSKSPRRWSAPTPSTSSSSTPSRRLYRVPRSKARWAIPTWVCRPA